MDNQENNNVVNNNMADTNNYASNTVTIPLEYKPISMWGYFGYEILFTIPCIGFILLCVFAFGGTQNVNLKNFARSYFCGIIIIAVLFLLGVVVFGVGAGLFGALGASSSSM